MGLIAVRREVLEALRSNPEWSAKLEKARTMQEVEKVLVEFCKAEGFKVERR